MTLPPDLQLRLARLSADLAHLQRTVHALMQQPGRQGASARPEDVIASAQYLALEAALHTPEPVQPRATVHQSTAKATATAAVAATATAAAAAAATAMSTTTTTTTAMATVTGMATPASKPPSHSPVSEIAALR